MRIFRNNDYSRYYKLKLNKQSRRLKTAALF